MGGGLCPPSPPFFLFSRASVLQNIRILLKPVVRAVCLQMGGGGLRTPPLHFSLQSRAEACFKVKYAVQACFIEHCVCNTLNPKPLNP